MCLGGIRLARLIATEFYTVNLALRANGLSKTCARLAPKKTATRINWQRFLVAGVFAKVIGVSARQQASKSR